MIGRARDAWRRLDVTIRDAPLALLLAVAPFTPGLQEQATRVGTLPDRPLDGVGLVAVALESLPLALRRRRPAAVLAVVAAGFALDQLRGHHTVSGAGLVVALVSAGAHVERHRRTVSLVLAAGYVALVATIALLGGSEGLAAHVTFALLLAAAWGAGTWLRQTRAAETRERERVAERSRAEERTRLARDLHDVVTHHVTAMVVQTEAARYRTGDELDATLTAVSGTGRRALADLRHLLDVLDPGHGPDPRTPAVGDVHELVARAREAGQPVDLVEDGEPAPTPGTAEATAYRVVQEALTNALKHAHGRATTVRVRHGADGIDVRVTTSGPATASPGGSGRGLAGLRARVGLLGGDLDAGPHGDGFVVAARIPVGTS